jgi:hypothetical protein
MESAEAPREPTSKAPLTITAQRPTVTRGGTPKGPLPDPALLDGSVQPPEKKSEYGMIGEFEMAGDENVRNGKVGGPQNPGQQGQQGQQRAGGASGGMPMGLPQGGGGAPSAQSGQPPGGMSAQAGGSQQAGGQQGGGPENSNAAGNPVAGAGDAGAQPQGIQVADLGGAAGQEGATGGNSGGGGGKPRPITIGDNAMRIEQPATPPGVVGAKQKIEGGYVQQHEKTGTGGKPPTSQQGPGRIEKGRTIPAGL